MIDCLRFGMIFLLLSFSFFFDLCLSLLCFFFFLIYILFCILYFLFRLVSSVFHLGKGDKRLGFLFVYEWVLCDLNRLC